MIYYVALFDTAWHGERYHRGDILLAGRGAGPCSGAWANFEPPKELEGIPILAHVADNGTGDLVFRYTIAESKTGFILKARIGLPQAFAVIEQPSSPRDAPSPVPKSQKPVLKFNAGLVASSGRSFVGFVAKSRFRDSPVKRSSMYDDPLHYDNGIDPLRRGLED